MNNLLKKAILIILICSFNTSAFSLSSEWSQAEVSKVRLISPFTNNNNQDEFILGLQYKMDPGWKTYWKSPGDGGFAQDLIWEKSTNIDLGGSGVRGEASPLFPLFALKGYGQYFNNPMQRLLWSA